MSVSSTNYAQPVQVNGFTCKNCTDVDNAKKHIDPAHPASGPYDVNAATDPTRKTAASATADTPAVSFGGTLAALNAVQAGAQAANSANASGSRVDVSA